MGYRLLTEHVSSFWFKITKRKYRGLGTEDWHCRNTVSLLPWISRAVALVPGFPSSAGPGVPSLFVRVVFLPLCLGFVQAALSEVEPEVEWVEINCKLGIEVRCFSSNKILLNSPT